MRDPRHELERLKYLYGFIFVLFSAAWVWYEAWFHKLPPFNH